MPAAWPVQVQRFVEAQLGSAPTAVEMVHGGCINQAARVRGVHGDVFLKWQAWAAPGFYDGEVSGLRALSARGLQAPHVLAVMQSTQPGPQALMMQWIEPRCGRPSRRQVDNAGRDLAALHKQRGLPPGLHEDNWIGSLRQRNDTPDGASWVQFFRQRRITDLSSTLPPSTRKLLDRIPFDEILTEPEGGCALLHGDLWGGNILWHGDNRAYYIDPAVYAGHPEVDLAMTRLFGGFDSRFYDAYQDMAGRFDSDMNDRLDVLNLYPLLVHARLFGQAYVAQLNSVACRYAR